MWRNASPPHCSTSCFVSSAGALALRSTPSQSAMQGSTAHSAARSAALTPGTAMTSCCPSSAPVDQRHTGVCGRACEQAAAKPHAPAHATAGGSACLSCPAPTLVPHSDQRCGAAGLHTRIVWELHHGGNDAVYRSTPVAYSRQEPHRSTCVPHGGVLRGLAPQGAATRQPPAARNTGQHRRPTTGGWGSERHAHPPPSCIHDNKNCAAGTLTVHACHTPHTPHPPARGGSIVQPGARS